MQTIPLFPLHQVLFPGGKLPLRIFEPRYIDLVSECLRADSGFGVCCIRQGKEVGAGAQCYDVGTYARIVDWCRLDDGLLGITTQAETRFRVEQFSERANTLLEAKIQWLEEDEVHNIGEDYHALQLLLTRIFEHYGISYEDQAQGLQESAWLGYRLAELLPLDLNERQAILEIDDSLKRLSKLQHILNESDAVEFGDR